MNLWVVLCLMFLFVQHFGQPCYINKTNLNLTLIKQIKYFIGLITSHNLWDL